MIVYVEMEFFIVLFVTKNTTLAFLNLEAKEINQIPTSSLCCSDKISVASSL